MSSVVCTPGQRVLLPRRFFLDNVAGWILELDRGQGIPFEGNYSQWLQAKARRLSSEAKQQSALQASLDAELEWINSKAKGQQKKGKARMRRYDELVSQASHASASKAAQLGWLALSPQVSLKVQWTGGGLGSTAGWLV